MFGTKLSAHMRDTGHRSTICSVTVAWTGGATTYMMTNVHIPTAWDNAPLPGRHLGVTMP